MAWFGDGRTVNERNKIINVSYLDYDNIDFPFSRQYRGLVNGEVKQSTLGNVQEWNK
jgi:hypothetical protein